MDVNHTLIYYIHAMDGCCCNVHSPKTKAGVGRIPVLTFVKETSHQERVYQKWNWSKYLWNVSEANGSCFVYRVKLAPASFLQYNENRKNDGLVLMLQKT